MRELPESHYAAWDYGVGRGFHKEAQEWAVFLFLELPDGMRFPVDERAAAFVMSPDVAEAMAAKLQAEVEIVRGAEPN